MIKFLILCTVFLLLYLGFSAIGEYDSALQFTVLGYQIDTTLFTLKFFAALRTLVFIIVFVV